MKLTFIFNFLLCYIIFIPNAYTLTEDSETKYENDIIDSIKPKSLNFVSLKKRIKSLNSKRNDPVFDTIPIYVLAKAGFYYEEGFSKSEVLCFFCNAKITDKVFNHDNKKTLYPYLDHAKENPDCLYLKAVMGTLFLDKFVGKLYEYSLYGEILGSLNTLEERVKSFEDYNEISDLNAENFSKAGFCYKKSSKDIECFYCNMKIRLDSHKSHDLDQLFAEHAKYFPCCEYIKSLKGLIFTDNHDAKRDIQFRLKSTTYSQMKACSKRKDSFKCSAQDFSDNCIDEIVNAGFFKIPCAIEKHSGHDCLRCFDCHLTLHQYSKDDNPFYLHRIKSRKCLFINNTLNEIQVFNIYRNNKYVMKNRERAITTEYAFNLQSRLDSFTLKQETVDLFYDLGVGSRMMVFLLGATHCSSLKIY